MQRVQFSNLIVLLTASVSFFALAQTPPVSKPTLTVRSQVNVSSDQIYLGDLVQFNEVDPQVEAQLSKISVAASPTPGQTLKLSNSEISRAIRRGFLALQTDSSSTDFNGTQLKIPAEVVVKGIGFQVSEDDLRERLMAKASVICGECELQITELRIPPLRTSERDIQWDFASDLTNLHGPSTLSLELTQGQKILDRIFVTGQFKISKTVPVLKRTLKIGERIQEGDFEWLKKDVTQLAEPSPTANEVVGARLKRSARASQILVRGDLEREKAVDRGEFVDVTVNTDSWKITLKGQAQESGFVGDVVKVLNPSTKRVLSGVVVAKGMVEMK